MTLGEKIKNARKIRHLTQTQLAGKKITRNMISRIENGTALPSLDTMHYLAKELSLPLSYLLSEDDDLFFYEKNEKITAIRSAYKNKEYSYCIKKIKAFSAVDSELAYIMTNSYFQLGKEAIKSGNLKTALSYFDLAKTYSSMTVFDTKHIITVMEMYQAIARNIQSPLLEFESDEYALGLCEVFDYEMFSFLTKDFDYEYKNPNLRECVRAKRLIKERRYQDAISVLDNVLDTMRAHSYDSYLVFVIYQDLEFCYKELLSFENAYKYSTKRLSLLEKFKQ